MEEVAAGHSVHWQEVVGSLGPVHQSLLASAGLSQAGLRRLLVPTIIYGVLKV